MLPNVIQSRFIPQDAVKLGRFTTSIDNPHQNYHDPSWTKPTLAVNSPLGSFIGMHETASDYGFASSLTSVVSALFSKRAKSKLYIVADRVLTSVLDNSDSWFKEATKLPATQSWIEQQIDQGNDIYMIVGFHSVTNAHIIQESHRGTAADGQIQLPAALALAAAGVIVPLGDTLNPSVGGHRQILDETQSQFQILGDQICALQYRKVCHAWLSSKRVDKSRLSQPWWSSVEKWRDEEEGEDDIIEVGLAELEDLDERWVREASGDEVFLVPQSEES
jgi:hypothetical protein